MKTSRLVFLSAAIAGTIFLFAGCKKTDWVHLPPSMSDRKCDYLTASSKGVSDDGNQLLPLFTKKYKPGTFKLEQIKMQYRNAAGGPGYDPATFAITYQGQQMILAKNNGDTTLLEFDNKGELKKAFSNEIGTPFNYRFIYSGNKIKEIQNQYVDDSPYADKTWYSYVKLTYDGSRKNLSTIAFSADNTISYEYNYNKKAKGQYYPDERVGQYYFFWTLLRYLNTFPELQPENVLTRSFYQTSDYPGNIDAKYSNHQFDAGGNLISYKATMLLFGKQHIVEDWKLNWTCFNNH